jgi:effector-binding domain-containing protein
MAVVTVEKVSPRILAAVKRNVGPGGAGAAWKPALDQVWAFLRSQPGLRERGHNVFLYRHPARPGDPMEAAFGVEVVRAFARAGEVEAVTTPPGEAAVATHRGPYDRMHETHGGIRHWMEQAGRASAGWSWEIYGDPSGEPETTIAYLLA